MSQKSRKYAKPPNHWLLLWSLSLFVLAAVLAFGVKTPVSVLVLFSAFVPAIRWFQQVSNYTFKDFTDSEVAGFVISTPVWIVNQKKRD